MISAEVVDVGEVFVRWKTRPGPKLGFVSGVRGWQGGLVSRCMFLRCFTHNYN